MWDPEWGPGHQNKRQKAQQTTGFGSECLVDIRGRDKGRTRTAVAGGAWGTGDPGPLRVTLEIKAILRDKADFSTMREGGAVGAIRVGGDGGAPRGACDISGSGRGAEGRVGRTAERSRSRLAGSSGVPPALDMPSGHRSRQLAPPWGRMISKA